MSWINSPNSRTRGPEDIVAIFHCSFHPTQGNVIDWSMKASDELNLNGVEFSTLPSGLHQVDEDVVHITQEVHHGISIFRRTPTTEPGMRGFRLESLGILVAQSTRPRPWRHLKSLKELARQLEDRWASLQSSISVAEDTRDWSLLKEWYSRRVFRRVGEEGQWVSWEEELASDPDHPAVHLPHLLRLLGPSALTLYKHVLARRRVLIYTHPVVEPACILARIASDMCGEGDRPNVLGMVGINDVDKLNTESWRGNGWIACTTDAIFLDKPSLYDLVIDFTANQTRPTFFVSRAASSSSRGPRHRLHPVRFTFSDVRLWSELDRTLRADADEAGCAHENKTRWSDSSRMYEDVCMVCAGFWMGGLRSGGTPYSSFSLSGLSAESATGAIRLEDDAEDQAIRTVGRGIEGRPVMTVSQHAPSNGELPRQARTTLALFNIFHAHSEFLSERLSELLDEANPGQESSTEPLVLSPRDVMALELGVLSELDTRFLEWLAERNEKSGGRKVVVRRGWKDLLGVLLGFA